jgi:two-component system, sensor histidine kinase PdtaS
MKKIALIVLLFLLVKNLFSQVPSASAIEKLLENAETSLSKDSSIYFLNEAIKISETTINSTEKGFLLYRLGKYCIQNSDYPNAEKYITTALVLSIKTKDKNLEALCMLELGRCNQFDSKYEVALRNMLKGLEIADETTNTENWLRANVYLADYYRGLVNFPEAKKYMQQAFRVAPKHIVDAELEIELYNRAAAIKTETGDLDSALYYSNTALNICKKTNNINQQATSLNEIGYIFENKNKFISAVEMYEEAEGLWRKRNAVRHWLNAMENRARVYFKMGDYKKSNALAGDAALIAERNNWLPSMHTIYLIQEACYAKQGNMEYSYRYSAKAADAKLKLYMQRNGKVLEEIKEKYANEKKEILLKKQEGEIENANLKFENQRKNTTRLWYGVLGLFLFIIFIAIIAIQRSRINKQLNFKNKEVEGVNKKLTVSLSKSEVLLQEVHHRVKNNLQFISSIIELEIDTGNAAPKEDSLADISRRITAMSLVHELLYNQDNLERVSAKKYIEKLMVSMTDMINTNHLQVKFDMKIDDITFEVKQCIAVGMIISELVSNSIKHAFEKQKNPVVVIELTQLATSKKSVLKVGDNGGGFSKKIKTVNGMGSRLVHIFTTQLNGTYTIETEKHFLFTFEFLAI